MKLFVSALVKARTDKSVDSATSRGENHVPLTEIPVCRSRNFDDMTNKGRVSKRLKATEIPKVVMEEASASSIAFGKHLASLITSQCDQAKVESYPPGFCTEQALAHLAQFHVWVASEAQKATDFTETNKLIKLKPQTSPRLQLQRGAGATHQARLKAEQEVVDLRESNKKNLDLSVALASANSTIGLLKMEVGEAWKKGYDKGFKDGIRDLTNKIKEELMPNL